MTEDWLHLKKYGYAPGGYMITCGRCKKIRVDLDKRATTCRACAEALYAAEPCDVPPAGWDCSREKGHEGPCAATASQWRANLMIVDGYVFKAVPRFIPVRDKKGDPLRMERAGWETEGCPLAKITFHDSASRDNPVLTMLRQSGMIVAEQTKGY